MALFLVLVAITSVQIGASLAKTMFASVGPLGTTFLRISIAAMVLNLVWRPWRFRLDQKSVKAILLYGITLGGMNICFYLALTKLSLGVCVTLEFTGPLALSFFLSRRKTDFLWAALALLGVLLIEPHSPRLASASAYGVFLALGAGAFWAAYILAGKKISHFLKPGLATSLGMTVAALCALPFALASGEMANIDLTSLKLGSVVALLSSALPYSLEMLALKKLPARAFGVLMSLEPAAAALAGRCILGERLSLNQVAGIVCIFSASTGSILSTRKAKLALPINS